LRFWLSALALLCAAAMFSVTVLGSDGQYRRYGPKDCLTILEDRTACSNSAAWYRIAEEKPASDGCPRRLRRSEDGKLCLALVDPIEVEISR
jgi:hypothetical protein